MRSFAGACLIGLILTACHPSPAIHLETARVEGGTRLTLVVPDSLKVNARLVPALELTNGTVVRLDQGARTADSAYFLTPPTALVSFPADAIHGTLRIGVCRKGEQVCEQREVRL